MKKPRILVILTVVFAMTVSAMMTGCNNNDDNEESSVVSSESDLLTGQWQSERKTDYVYTFNGDGTGQYKMAGIDYDMTYSVENGQITIALQAEGYLPITFDYFLEGDRLNIRDSYGKDNLLCEGQGIKAELTRPKYDKD